MIPDNFIEIYNPDNAKNLNDEQIAAMQDLTTDQLQQIAKAYPNKPRGNNYLVLINKNLKAGEQIYQLNTWQNLYNLHNLGQKHFAAHNFRSRWKKPTPVPVKTEGQKAVVVDITEQEKMLQPGLQKIPTVNDEAFEGDSIYNTGDNAATDEVAELEKQLEEKKGEGAHPNTIRAIEKKIAAAKEKAAASQTGDVTEHNNNDAI